jgi:hypothetical protein
MNPHSYAHLIFAKFPKIYYGEKTASSTNVAEKSGYLPADPCLSPCTSINSKWIRDLNIRPKILKLVHERAGNTLEIVGMATIPQ